MGRATALCYPLLHFPSTSFPLAALPHPFGNVSSVSKQSRAAWRASSVPHSPPSKISSTAGPIQLHWHYSRFTPGIWLLCLPNCIKKNKIKNIPAAFAPVTIGADTWLSRSSSSPSLPSLTASSCSCEAEQRHHTGERSSAMRSSSPLENNSITSASRNKGHERFPHRVLPLILHLSPLLLSPRGAFLTSPPHPAPRLLIAYLLHSLFIPSSLFSGGDHLCSLLSPLPHKSTTLFLENCRMTFPPGTATQLPGRSPPSASTVILR